MPEAMTTWTMSRRARAEAAQRAITDTQIAAAIADQTLTQRSRRTPGFGA